MTRQVTRWWPDTCKCSIDYEWDSDIDPEQREHASVAHDDSKCELHSFNDHTEAWDRVLADNQRKNVAYGVVLEHARAHLPHLVDNDALAGETFQFRYDSDGHLLIALPNHSHAMKEAVAAQIKSEVTKPDSVMVQ